MKKTLRTIVVISVILAVLLSAATAFAGGHGGGHCSSGTHHSYTAKSSTKTVCPLGKDCPRLSGEKCTQKNCGYKTDCPYNGDCPYDGDCPYNNCGAKKHSSSGSHSAGRHSGNGTGRHHRY